MPPTPSRLSRRYFCLIQRPSRSLARCRISRRPGETLPELDDCCELKRRSCPSRGRPHPSARRAEESASESALFEVLALGRIEDHPDAFPGRNGAVPGAGGVRVAGENIDVAALHLEAAILCHEAAVVGLAVWTLQAVKVRNIEDGVERNDGGIDGHRAERGDRVAGGAAPEGKLDLVEQIETDLLTRARADRRALAI